MLTINDAACSWRVTRNTPGARARGGWGEHWRSRLLVRGLTDAGRCLPQCGEQTVGRTSAGRRPCRGRGRDPRFGQLLIAPVLFPRPGWGYRTVTGPAFRASPEGNRAAGITGGPFRPPAASPGRIPRLPPSPGREPGPARTAVLAPRMNAICERLTGTLRRELLDRTLILNQAHLRAVLAEYQEHYNTARPHQGIDQRVPDPGPAPRVTATDPARARSAENRSSAA